MSITVSALYIYPVKSCRGIELTHCALDKYGFRHDRSLLIVDENGLAITQRDCPKLALVQVELVNSELFGFHYPGLSSLSLNPNKYQSEPDLSRTIEAQVWDDRFLAFDLGSDAADWFSEICGRACRLVSRCLQYERKVSPKYASGSEEVSFADGFPLLLISQESLDDLNAKMEAPVPMDRFRPNLVLSGAGAFAEDKWRTISINGVEFDLVKPCARCVMVTIDQDTAEIGKEPMRTLSAYRKSGNKVMFGQNLIHKAHGEINVGDKVEILFLN